MRVRSRDVDRRTVVEAYAAYDCSKTGRPLPKLSAWDWAKADAIDQELRGAGLKYGVLGGYRVWDLVEVTLPNLRECAVLASIFPGQPRSLGLIESSGGVVGWKPDREAVWFKAIVGGQVLDEDAPLILRPALSGEAPASWYVEDGSGRAIASIANHHAFRPSQTLAVAYLGREPDQASSFMQQTPFRELLTRG